MVRPQIFFPFLSLNKICKNFRKWWIIWGMYLCMVLICNSSKLIRISFAIIFYWVIFSQVSSCYNFFYFFPPSLCWSCLFFFSLVDDILSPDVIPSAWRVRTKLVVILFVLLSCLVFVMLIFKKNWYWQFVGFVCSTHVSVPHVIGSTIQL